MGSGILSLLLLAASAGLFFGVVDPTYQQFGDLQERINRLQEANNKAQEFDEVLLGLNSQYTNIPAADKARLLKFMPDHIDNIRLIINVYGIAESHNLEVVEFGEYDAAASPTTRSSRSADTSAIDQNRPYGETRLQFSLIGSYEDFVAFMSDIERSLRLVDVSQLVVESDREGGDQYIFSFVVDTYWLKAAE